MLNYISWQKKKKITTLNNNVASCLRFKDKNKMKTATNAPVIEYTHAALWAKAYF